MRKMLTARSIATELIATMALLVLIAGPAAMAQTGGGAGSRRGKSVATRPRSSGRPPPAARRSGAVGEKPERSERSG